MWVGFFPWVFFWGHTSVNSWQPTDTWQPASPRSTAFRPYSLEITLGCRAQKSQENYAVVGCQVKCKAKHKLKCKPDFTSGSSVPAGWKGLTSISSLLQSNVPPHLRSHPPLWTKKLPRQTALLHLRRGTGVALPGTTRCSQGGKAPNKGLVV